MEFNTIQDFRHNFTQVYHKSVAPKLESFEQEKNKIKLITRIIWIITVAIIAGLLFLFNFQITQDTLFLVIAPFFLCIGICGWLGKSFEKKLKLAVMPIVMRAFGDFVWVPAGGTIPDIILKMTRLFERFEDKKDDDSFYGTYKGLQINIDETELSYTTRDSEGRRHKHIVFSGVLAQIDFKKPFKGHTIIRTRGLFNSKAYEEVKLEDPEFSKMYFVDANDQIEARYILTTSFMERFKNIKNSFSASQMEASIQDSKILIAIHTTKDLFKLGDLNRPVNDTKQFTELLNEFVSILAIVDELKLNQNIGL